MFSRWRERLRHTLGFRLALWYALVFLASSTALIGLTYLLLATTLRQYDREVIERTLVQYVAAYARGGVDALAREIRTSQIGAAQGPLFVRAVGVRREVIFLSMPEAWYRFDLDRLRLPELTNQQAWSTLQTGAGGAVLEVASVRLSDGTLFQVGKSTERRVELLQRFQRVLLLDLGSIILIALAGGAVLTSSALKPVRTLAATVREIMRTGRTDARVPAEDSGDALGELTVLVNAMLQRIDAVVAGMRGALDNVAHDLRTPVTRLRGIAEAALQSNDPDVLREALADCVEEADRLASTLNTLMDISEAETGTMKLRVESTNVSDVIRQAVDLYEDLAEEQGVTIEINAPEQVEAPLDRIRIRQVIANLLDNAIKYTPAGGRISIDAAETGDDMVVAVTDTGAGIHPEDLPRIWDRLYRGDRSRSTRGLGLGLSLVRAIVHAHGGRVDVHSAPGAGSRFELRLPKRPVAAPTLGAS
jgi:signal transduction histidine kinase